MCRQLLAVHSAGLWSLSHDAQHLAHFFGQHVQLSSTATADVISQARLLDLGVPRTNFRLAVSWAWALDNQKVVCGYSDLSRGGVLIISLDGHAAYAKVFAMLKSHFAQLWHVLMQPCRSIAMIK